MIAAGVGHAELLRVLDVLLALHLLVLRDQVDEALALGPDQAHALALQLLEDLPVLVHELAERELGADARGLPDVDLFLLERHLAPGGAVDRQAERRARQPERHVGDELGDVAVAEGLDPGVHAELAVEPGLLSAPTVSTRVAATGTAPAMLMRSWLPPVARPRFLQVVDRLHRLAAGEVICSEVVQPASGAALSLRYSREARRAVAGEGFERPAARRDHVVVEHAGAVDGIDNRFGA